MCDDNNTASMRHAAIFKKLFLCLFIEAPLNFCFLLVLVLIITQNGCELQISIFRQFFYLTMIDIYGIISVWVRL